MSANVPVPLVERRKEDDRRGCTSVVARYVTIVNWLPKYSRIDAISDFVAGFSLGLTLIPQSIAYAALAGLTAQYGLYSCLMGNFLYLFFGTIKEVSIGPSSLMSLLTIEYTRNMPIDFVVLFCFLSGCVELLMGVLRLGIEKLSSLFQSRYYFIVSFTGFLVDFISMPVTSGFTSATSIIIIISQLQGLLGLKFKAHNIVDNLIKICQNFGDVRTSDFMLGACSIVFLLLCRRLKDIDCCYPKIDGRTKMYLKKLFWFLSICRNALVILIATTISYNLEKRGSSPFILSGKIQSGLPQFSLPPFSSQVGNQTYTFWDMCSHYRSGIIVVPLVAVLANIAIAKAFASGRSVNATQEMLTLGLCNILGSFVSSMPTAGAFTRSAVVSASGVRTPMAGIYVGTMTLLALSFLTPYFYYIPRTTLAAVLISAVVFMIDLKILRLLWRGSRKDAIAAIVTFSVSVTLGVEVGLLTGALFSLIYFLRPPARPKIEVTQCKTQLGNKYVILKPESSLLYPAANYFCNQLMKIIRKNDESNVPFIVDCERIRNIDYTAIKGIDVIAANMNAEQKRLWFMNVSSKTLSSIKAFGNEKHFHFIDEEDEIAYIFHDGRLMNVDETKEERLGNVTDRITFNTVNDDKNLTNPAEKIALITSQETRKDEKLQEDSC